MSWSIEVTGTRAGVIKKVTEQLDKTAAQYGGTEEGKDVLVAKEKILSLVGALDLTPDSYYENNGVVVKANGSHSVGTKGLVGANMAISVLRTSLTLDPTS